MRRWLFFLGSILVGITIGVFYGLIIQPVEHIDTTLETLHIDYRTDYVLMVAETFALEGNLASARRRLEKLDSAPALEILRQAILHAEQVGYTDLDLERFRRLQNALEQSSAPVLTPPP